MALPACGFAVYADKAGQLPLAIERRAKGKRVTIINGVKGNARALCQSLTSLLGVGGTVHSKGQFFDVEVQGEQTERVSSALRQLACVRGPGGVKLKEAAVVERGCAYDEFLRQEEAPNARRKERWEAGLRLRCIVLFCCFGMFWHYEKDGFMTGLSYVLSHDWSPFVECSDL